MNKPVKIPFLIILLLVSLVNLILQCIYMFAPSQLPSIEYAEFYSKLGTYFGASIFITLIDIAFFIFYIVLKKERAQKNKVVVTQVILIIIFNIISLIIYPGLFVFAILLYFITGASV